MTPERWQQVEAILNEALERSAPERAHFLNQACGDDEELRSETATLIAAHEAAGDFIEQPALASDAQVILGYHAATNIGREIGVYRLVESLGAGGMGEVYLAEDNRLDRLVALKLLPPYFAADDERLARFQREARTASALNHPNILTIYEVGEAEEVRFIATEFIDGDTIQQLISNQSLTLKDVLDIAAQVLTGLAAAHAAGIVHRDIKPDNIMRRRDGLVKLLDFGIAKLLEPQSASAHAMQTETGALLGTVAYMSPEQARGLPVDERSDIWSFGVVLYQMLTQRLPFAGATRMDTLVNILEREPEPLFKTEARHFAPELKALTELVKKTLQKERDDRYQSANELLDELKRFPPVEVQTLSELVAQEAANTASARTESVDGSNRRNRYLLASLAVLVLALTAGGFFYQGSLTNQPGNGSERVASSVAEKSYAEMSEDEQLDFIRVQEQRISAMMGDRPGKLNEEALRAINSHIDRYLARDTKESQDSGVENLQSLYARSHAYIPAIARSFSERKVPVIIGIYLPMIESAYRPCFESSLGAKGLFQFMPQTAQRYGISPDERCQVEKAAPAAASYIADHMAELGDDAESMTLVLLSYNTGATWVRGTLRQLRDTENFERTFWTLFNNRDQLDETFREESAGYVPMFFAAAIIGENPRSFGLDMQPLSTLTRQ